MFINIPAQYNSSAPGLIVLTEHFSTFTVAIDSYVIRPVSDFRTINLFFKIVDSSLQSFFFFIQEFKGKSIPYLPYLTLSYLIWLHWRTQGGEGGCRPP